MVWRGKNVVVCFDKNSRAEIDRCHHASLGKPCSGKRRPTSCGTAMGSATELWLEDHVSQRLCSRVRVAARLTGDATTDKRSRFRAEASPGHRMVETCGKDRRCHHRSCGGAPHLQKAESDQRRQRYDADDPAKLFRGRRPGQRHRRRSPSSRLAARSRRRTFSGKSCAILANEIASATLLTHNEKTIGSRCANGDAMHPENNNRNAPTRTIANAAPLTARMRNVGW